MQIQVFYSWMERNEGGCQCLPHKSPSQSYFYIWALWGPQRGRSVFPALPAGQWGPGPSQFPPILTEPMRMGPSFLPLAAFWGPGLHPSVSLWSCSSEVSLDRAPLTACLPSRSPLPPPPLLPPPTSPQAMLSAQPCLGSGSCSGSGGDVAGLPLFLFP